MLGACIRFEDVTGAKRLQVELEASRQHLETAYEELQATNEELETTNEELQSTVEELETTNEELQSTNEELETMNEELQATNEELQAINDELRLRSEELNGVNEFLETIFRSLGGSVVVLDRDLRVLVWSASSEDLWGLRASEAQDASFTSLDIGLPVGELLPLLRGALAGDRRDGRATVRAINRRGKAVTCTVIASPLLGSDGEPPRGVILQMEATEARD